MDDRSPRANLMPFPRGCTEAPTLTDPSAVPAPPPPADGPESEFPTAPSFHPAALPPGAKNTPAADDSTLSPDPDVVPVPAGVRGPAVPRFVAGYEVLGILGRGGMGVVFKARQVALNRLVALKMLRSPLA